jgi:hypothetical protein
MYLRIVLSAIRPSAWCLNSSTCLQVPFMVGDFVTYAGVTTGAGFFAVYEIVSNVAVYTKVSRRCPTLQSQMDSVHLLGQTLRHAVTPHCWARQPPVAWCRPPERDSRSHHGV